MKKHFFTLLLAVALWQPITAQWQAYDTGLPAEDILWFISAPSPDVVWGISHQNSNYFFSPGRHFVRTTDGGATWKTGDINDVDSELSTSLFALNQMTAWVGRYDFNTGAGSIWKTANGGATWAKQPIPFDDPFGFPDVIYFWDAQNGFIMGDPDSKGYFEIYTTRDGGQNWRRTPEADIPALISPSEYGLTHGYDAAGANTLWFGTNFGRVYKTTDRGLTWTAVQTPMYDASPYGSIQTMAFENERVGLALSTVNPNVDSAAVEPKIIRTTDGGATWTSLVNSNSDDYNQKGLLLAIPGADNTYFAGSFNEAIGVSYNGGEHWDFDPTIASAGGQFFDPKTGWISTYHLGGTGGEILKFTGNLSPATIRNVTLQVDMGGVAVSPAGVHVAVNYFGWNPSSILMTNMGNGFYETTLHVPAGTTIRYKFINGNAWGQNESVPSGCGSLNPAGSYDRVLTVGQWDMRQPVTCFGSCMGCGDTAPAGAFYCASGSLQCEIFDWYNAGALASPNWLGSGATVTGYYHGYTNYSGGRALHVGTGSTAIYKLGNRHGGPYNITMKVYVPRDREARLSLLADQNNPASAVFNFALETNRTAWSSDGSSYKAYPQDDWLDLKITADVQNGEVTVWVNGQQAAHQNQPLLTQLGALAFTTPSKFTEFLVDDIGLKSQGANKPTLFVEGVGNESSVYPNPASETLFVPFDLPETSDLTLTLTDLSGRILMERKLEGVQAGVEAISLEDVSNGIYLLKGEGGGMKVFVQQVAVIK